MTKVSETLNPMVTPAIPLLYNENIMVMQTNTGFLIRYLIPASNGTPWGKWAQGTGATYEAALVNVNKNLQNIL